ncbi:MAG: hypothetical protein ABJB76_03725 [Candidatus Nitrosocosmicus sp.]
MRKDNTIESEEPTHQLMTSWELLYHLLRDVFPDKLHHNERKMTIFEQKKDHIVVHFGENRKDEICDLLVGADGVGSTMRHQLLPHVLQHYAGYVAWRGLVNENEVSSKVLNLFSNTFTFFIGQKTHILCYLIPGLKGELTAGSRRLNWVWYVNVPVQGDILKKVMTDKNGILREFSVPQGMVNEDIVKKQINYYQGYYPREFSTVDICNKRAIHTSNL